MRWSRLLEPDRWDLVAADRPRGNDRRYQRALVRRARYITEPDPILLVSLPHLFWNVVRGNKPLGLDRFPRVREGKIDPISFAPTSGAVSLRAMVVRGDHPALIERDTRGLLREKLAV